VLDPLPPAIFVCFETKTKQNEISERRGISEPIYGIWNFGILGLGESGGRWKEVSVRET
jgi:hypothetical protein